MYLVAGGYHTDGDGQVVRLNSTEIMVEEEIGWVLIQEHPLPHPMNNLRGISVQNKIFMIGRNVLRLSTQILPYNDFAIILIHKFRQSCMKPTLLNIS